MIDVRNEQNRQRLVGLIWLYFVLLILEGALRKWVFQDWSNVLLIARDPVAAVVIYLAARDGYLPADGLMRSFLVLLVAFVALSIFQLGLTGASGPVILYGLRTYFLHVPLIFVIARVLDGPALRRLTLAILIVAVPIALLMVQQFKADRLDWINRGVGVGGLQITSALGKIRPSGPFSFISGPIQYFALVLACLIESHFSRGRFPAAIRWCGWAALFVAAAVSGSRSLLAGLVFVLVATVAALGVRPRLVGGFLKAAVTAVTIVMLVWTSSDVQEGVEVFQARLELAGSTQDVLARSSESYQGAWSAITTAPILGAGIGVGTNAGGALTVGGTFFGLGEAEWTRVILEAGPLLGVAYLAWRFWLVVLLARAAWRAAALGYTFPILLLGACATNLLSGQWGQPTTQGFAVAAGGLCLAACRLSSVAMWRSQMAPGAVAGARPFTPVAVA